MEAVTLRKAVLLCVNTLATADKTLTSLELFPPSADTVPQNGSRTCFDGVSTSQERQTFPFPWVLRSQTKFLIWILD